MKKNKDVKKKSKKKLIFVLILIIVIVAGVFIYGKVTDKSPDKPKVKVIDSIKDFDYTVNDTDTKLFKTKFKDLKKVLSEKEVDNKEYSSLVAQLFIIDFFTLDNKITKNDVGGVQFVYENYRTSFIDKARDEFYKYINNNLNNNRNQELPIVSSIEVTSVDTVTASDELKTEEFKNIDEAYKVNLSWNYKKDLGYQKTATIIVVKDNKKFAVAKLSGDK